MPRAQRGPPAGWQPREGPEGLTLDLSWQGGLARAKVGDVWFVGRAERGHPELGGRRGCWPGPQRGPHHVK